MTVNQAKWTAFSQFPVTTYMILRCRDPSYSHDNGQHILIKKKKKKQTTHDARLELLRAGTLSQ